MPEPIETAPNPAGTGRPIISEEQYAKWIDDMREYLRRGMSLWYSMDKAGIIQHKDSIYEKYRQKDWFSERINALRATLGDYLNDVVFRTVEAVRNRMVETDGKTQMSTEEVNIIKLAAERSRAAQPYFANRIEEAESDEAEVGKVLEPTPLQITYVIPSSPTTEQPIEASADGEPAKTTDQVPADAQAAPSVATPDVAQ